MAVPVEPGRPLDVLQPDPRSIRPTRRSRTRAARRSSRRVDGGKNWRQVGGIPHSDHHAIWINPKNNNHILLGNDGGLDVSYDQGETWEYINTMALGQFYAVSADMRKPYYVCGGLQDNGSWCGPSGVRSANGILNSDWFRVGGGDGFYTANDPTDWRVLYSESQDGATRAASSCRAER